MEITTIDQERDEKGRFKNDQLKTIFEQKMDEAENEKSPHNLSSDELEQYGHPPLTETRATFDYARFKFDDANRNINWPKVRKIVEDFNPRIQELNPVVVNEDFYILDHQHSFLAAMLLDLPIYYKIAEGHDMQLAGIMHQYMDSWSLRQWVHYGATFGEIEDYQVLLDFLKESGISAVTPAVKLLNRDATRNDVKNQDFTVKHKEFAEDIVRQLEDLKEQSDLGFVKKSKFISAYRKFIEQLREYRGEEYNEQQLRDKIARLAPRFLDESFNQQAMYEGLIRIHNHSRSKNKLPF